VRGCSDPCPVRPANVRSRGRRREMPGDATGRLMFSPDPTSASRLALRLSHMLSRKSTRWPSQAVGRSSPKPCSAACASVLLTKDARKVPAKQCLRATSVPLILLSSTRDVVALRVVQVRLGPFPGVTSRANLRCPNSSTVWFLGAPLVTARGRCHSGGRVRFLLGRLEVLLRSYLATWVPRRCFCPPISA